MSKKRNNSSAPKIQERPAIPDASARLEQNEISERAYYLWLRRGCPQGEPDEDWNRAIRELTYERQGAAK